LGEWIRAYAPTPSIPQGAIQIADELLGKLFATAVKNRVKLSLGISTQD
jgi:hypothetical protein